MMVHDSSLPWQRRQGNQRQPSCWGARGFIMDDVYASELHIAVQVGKLARVKVLLQRGDKVSVRDAVKRTPLHWAVVLGCEDVAKTLLVNTSRQTLEAADSCGRTVLHYAAALGRLALAQLMLNRGANLHVKDKWQCTPLHLAAENVGKEMTEFLVGRGARKDARDCRGRLPMHIAKKLRGDELVELLFVKEAKEEQVQQSTPSCSSSAQLGRPRSLPLIIDVANDDDTCWLPSSRTGAGAESPLVHRDTPRPSAREGFCTSSQRGGTSHLLLASPKLSHEEISRKRSTLEDLLRAWKGEPVSDACESKVGEKKRVVCEKMERLEAALAAWRDAGREAKRQRAVDDAPGQASTSSRCGERGAAGRDRNSCSYAREARTMCEDGQAEPQISVSEDEESTSCRQWNDSAALEVRTRDILAALKCFQLPQLVSLEEEEEEAMYGFRTGVSGFKNGMDDSELNAASCREKHARAHKKSDSHMREQFESLNSSAEWACLSSVEDASWCTEWDAAVRVEDVERRRARECLEAIYSGLSCQI